MVEKKFKVSIIIPAFNEGENLPKLIENIFKTFEKSHFNNFEVIVVNDGSTDRTERVVENILDNFKNLTLINLKENVGKAYALDHGLKNSKGTIIATIDADLQYKAQDLIRMLEVIESGADLVNGKRGERQDTYLTKTFSKIYNFILRILFRTSINDFFSGIKVFKREIYDLMGYHGLSRFVIFFSRKYNFKISEIEIEHNKRLYGNTAYSFFDRVILSMKDIFTLVVCVALENKGVYQIKQIILVFYFISFLFIFFGKIFFNHFDLNDVFYVLTSLVALSILNTVIQAFLKSKEKRIESNSIIVRSIKNSN